MIKKYILTTLLFWVCSIATSQIMLPAYQGVFSTKTLSTVEASNGLNFDGVNDRVISTNDVKFQISVGTIEGWIKTGNAGSNYRGAFGKTFAYFLFLYNNELIIYDWGALVNRSTGITLNDNTWHHIAMSFNSGVTNGTLIYIDGILKSTTTMTIKSQEHPFTIGSSVDPYVQFYNGSIDDVRVWNVIRTQTEILDNMNAELLGSETGLVAYYPLNQGIAAGDNTTIAAVTNKSANALNGTLTNFTKTGETSNFVIGKVPSSLIDDGLILSLDANNINSYSGTGSTWNDVSGNNRNGTLLAGVTYTNESEIKYFNFSSSYVAINLPKNPSMTYFVWAKSSNASCTSPYMVLFSTGTVTAPADPQLFFRACYHCWNTQDANGNNFLISSGVVANYSAHGTNWHSYAVVNDAVTNTAKLYYDGIFVGAAVYKNSKIANFNIGNSVNLNSPWQGGIANVRAYNKSLTNSEIMNLYISTKGVFGF